MPYAVSVGELLFHYVLELVVRYLLFYFFIIGFSEITEIESYTLALIAVGCELLDGVDGASVDFSDAVAWFEFSFCHCLSVFYMLNLRFYDFYSADVVAEDLFDDEILSFRTGRYLLAAIHVQRCFFVVPQHIFHLVDVDSHTIHVELTAAGDGNE